MITYAFLTLGFIYAVIFVGILVYECWCEYHNED